ncbi:MAG TPA: EamA family transporter [Stellaceae bacterium]|nr:EamA family transporter [Stellaceae bacterium]
MELTQRGLGRATATATRSGEGLGILAAILSSALGGTNTAVTRFAIGATDPVTLAALRFGLGFLLLLPVALALRSRWPERRDWAGVAALGILFFGLFMSVFNLSLRYTTAARGALALSTLPLLTMVVGALLRAEPLTARKTSGVVVAFAGVAVALATGLADAPAGAWRGDLVMVAGALCMALYNVWSRPFIARSSPLAFVCAGMGAGSGSLFLLVWAGGGLAASTGFGARQWAAILYLAAFGAALTFFLWVFALKRTTPTRVASAITLNPITASLLAAPLLGEPIGVNLLIGVAGVACGIWIATTERRPPRHDPPTLDAEPPRLREPSRLSRSPSEIRSWWPHPPSLRRPLARLDDRALRDLGLDRAAVDDESTASFWRLR